MSWPMRNEYEKLTEKLWETSCASSVLVLSLMARTRSLYCTSFPSLASEFSACHQV